MSLRNYSTFLDKTGVISRIVGDQDVQGSQSRQDIQLVSNMEELPASCLRAPLGNTTLEAESVNSAVGMERLRNGIHAGLTLWAFAG